MDEHVTGNEGHGDLSSLDALLGNAPQEDSSNTSAKGNDDVNTDDSVHNQDKGQDENNDTVSFIFNGMEYNLTPEQIAANLGKGRLYDAAKRETHEYKTKYGKFAEAGIDDELVQAIVDYKQGNSSAKDYIVSRLSLVEKEDEEEAEEYTPQVSKEEEVDPFVLKVEALGDDVVEKFLDQDDLVSKELKESIFENVDPNRTNDFLYGLARDMADGTYDKLRPIAEHLAIQHSDKDMLSCYIEAGKILDNGKNDNHETKDTSSEKELKYEVDDKLSAADNFAKNFDNIPINELFN